MTTKPAAHTPGQSFYLLGDGILLGTIFENSQGWRFIPNISGRATSRKAWPTANAAIPRWAFSRSTELLTSAEWQARAAIAKAEGK